MKEKFENMRFRDTYDKLEMICEELDKRFDLINQRLKILEGRPITKKELEENYEGKWGVL